MTQRLALVCALIVPIILLGAGCEKADEVKQSQSLQMQNLNLQEKCAEGAKKYFQDGGFNSTTESFVNHYNTKLNKCFILVHSLQSQQNYYSDALIDAFEGLTYARIMVNFKDPLQQKVLECAFYPSSEVNDKNVVSCKSQDEFNNLTRSYMSD